MAQGGPANVGASTGGFAGNELDTFDNTTYNIKLYMIPESDFRAGKVDSDSKIIIAESGVTSRVSIDDLEIKSYISPSRTVKNQESVRFDFTLREYYGAELLDQIFVGSQQLGIKNYYKAPYFLELTFAGRDPDTSSPDIKAETLRWVWPISIRAIETEVDASGSLYNVESYVYTSLAQTDEAGNIPKAMTAQGKTVAEALTDLTDQLNSTAKEQAVTNVTLPDVYSITIDPKIGDLNLIDDKNTEANAKTAPMDTDERTVREISLDKNISITEAINRIVSVAPAYQTLSKKTGTPSDQEVAEKEDTKVMHRIFTKADIIDFDIGRGDYARTYTYDVLPFEASLPQVSVSESSADGKKVYNNLKNKGLLRKRYDYLYTGVNDQVLNFDLKFNFGWYVNMPSQGGLFTHYAAASEGQHASRVYQEYLRIREEIAESQKRAANVPNAEAGVDVQQEIDSAENLTDEERAQLEALLSAVISPRLPDNTETKSYQEKQNNNQSTRAGSLSPTSNSSRFVSDIRVTKEELDTAYKQYPLTYLENKKRYDSEDTNIARSVEGNRGAGQPFVNSLFQQSFSGKGGDLVNVEIEVKGDPFWLESKSGVESQGSVNSRSAQQNIVFSVQTADLPSEKTGITEHTSSPFSGVYAIRQVDHVFSGGKFTQTLYGVRDSKIGVFDIIEDLTNNA